MPVLHDLVTRLIWRTEYKAVSFIATDQIVLCRRARRAEGVASCSRGAHTRGGGEAVEEVMQLGHEWC
jgi:hypothetical protein